MNIHQFRSELAKAFEALGFERRNISGSRETTWVLPGREVDRAFWQHAMRRASGFWLSGSLVIDVPLFREWLASKFPPAQHGLLRNAIIGRLIVNYPDMLFTADTGGGPPPYGIWVAKIRERLAAIPDTVEGLLQAERAQSPGLMLLWDKNYSTPAWAYFHAWAIGQTPTTPPPATTPTGQIIYAPANDSI